MDIWLLTVNSGELERFTTDPGDQMNPDWAPDGEWIAFRSQGRSWRIPARCGETESLGTTSSGFARFSRDGQSLYVINNDGGARNVWAIDPETKVRRAVTKLEGRIGALGEIKPHRTIFGCDGKLRRGIIHALAESGSHGFWRLFAGARRRFTQ